MVAREQKGDALGRGHMTLHPVWLQILAADGQLFYLNTVPPYQVSVNFYTAPVGGTCGGARLWCEQACKGHCSTPAINATSRTGMYRPLCHAAIHLYIGRARVVMCCSLADAHALRVLSSTAGSSTACDPCVQASCVM